VRTPLQQAVQHLRPGRLGEGGEFAERDLGVVHAARGPQAHEDHALEPQLPVLDLGDVLEFRGQAGDAPQGAAFLGVELVAVVPARAGVLGVQRRAGPREDSLDDRLDGGVLAAREFLGTHGGGAGIAIHRLHDRMRPTARASHFAQGVVAVCRSLGSPRARRRRASHQRARDQRAADQRASYRRASQHRDACSPRRALHGARGAVVVATAR